MADSDVISVPVRNRGETNGKGGAEEDNKDARFQKVTLMSNAVLHVHTLLSDSNTTTNTDIPRLPLHAASMNTVRDAFRELLNDCDKELQHLSDLHTRVQHGEFSPDIINTTSQCTQNVVLLLKRRWEMFHGIGDHVAARKDANMRGKLMSPLLAIMHEFSQICQGKLSHLIATAARNLSDVERASLSHIDIGVMESAAKCMTEFQALLLPTATTTRTEPLSLPPLSSSSKDAVHASAELKQQDQQVIFVLPSVLSVCDQIANACSVPLASISVAAFAMMWNMHGFPRLYHAFPCDGDENEGILASSAELVGLHFSSQHNNNSNAQVSHIDGPALVSIGAMYTCFASEEWEYPSDKMLQEKAALEGKQRAEVDVTHHPLLHPGQGLYSCKFVSHALAVLQAAKTHFNELHVQMKTTTEQKQQQQRGEEKGEQREQLPSQQQQHFKHLEHLFLILLRKFQTFSVRCNSQTQSNPTPNLVGLSALLQLIEYYTQHVEEQLIAVSSKRTKLHTLVFHLRAVVGRLMSITLHQVREWVELRWQQHFDKHGEEKGGAVYLSKQPQPQQPSMWVTILTKELLQPLLEKCVNGYLHQYLTRKLLHDICSIMIHSAFTVMLGQQLNFTKYGCMVLQQDLFLLKTWLEGQKSQFVHSEEVIERYTLIALHMLKRCEQGNNYQPSLQDNVILPDLKAWLQLSKR